MNALLLGRKERIRTPKLIPTVTNIIPTLKYFKPELDAEVVPTTIQVGHQVPNYKQKWPKMST